jgi:hypothetical protein
MVGEKVYGRVSPQQVKDIIEEYAGAAESKIA